MAHGLGEEVRCNAEAVEVFRDAVGDAVRGNPTSNPFEPSKIGQENKLGLKIASFRLGFTRCGRGVGDGSCDRHHCPRVGPGQGQPLSAGPDPMKNCLNIQQLKLSIVFF
jgi:hypothetical protein